MFDYVGDTIKWVAKGLWRIGTVLIVIGSLVWTYTYIARDYGEPIWFPLVCGAVLVLMNFVGCIMMYGFGEIVEYVTSASNVTAAPIAPAGKEYKDGMLLCRHCWKRVSSSDKKCPYCGNKL